MRQAFKCQFYITGKQAYRFELVDEFKEDGK